MLWSQLFVFMGGVAMVTGTAGLGSSPNHCFQKVSVTREVPEESGVLTLVPDFMGLPKSQLR